MGQEHCKKWDPIKLQMNQKLIVTQI
jgi:hypothetical protein